MCAFQDIPDTNKHTASAATATADQETSSVFLLPLPTLTSLYGAFVLCGLGPQSAEA